MTQPVETRLEDDTVDQIDEYAEVAESDISRAEAMRRLLYAGLEAEGMTNGDDGDNGTSEQYAIILAFASIVALVVVVGGVSAPLSTTALTVAGAVVGGFGGSYIAS